jgi:hypothetical protein
MAAGLKDMPSTPRLDKSMNNIFKMIKTMGIQINAAGGSSKAMLMATLQNILNEINKEMEVLKQYMKEFQNLIAKQETRHSDEEAKMTAEQGNINEHSYEKAKAAAHKHCHKVIFHAVKAFSGVSALEAGTSAASDAYHGRWGAIKDNLKKGSSAGTDIDLAKNAKNAAVDMYHGRIGDAAEDMGKVALDSAGGQVVLQDLNTFKTCAELVGDGLVMLGAIHQNYVTGFFDRLAGKEPKQEKEALKALKKIKGLILEMLQALKIGGTYKSEVITLVKLFGMLKSLESKIKCIIQEGLTGGHIDASALHQCIKEFHSLKNTASCSEDKALHRVTSEMLSRVTEEHSKIYRSISSAVSTLKDKIDESKKSGGFIHGLEGLGKNIGEAALGASLSACLLHPEGLLSLTIIDIDRGDLGSTVLGGMKTATTSMTNWGVDTEANGKKTGVGAWDLVSYHDASAMDRANRQAHSKVDSAATQATSSQAQMTESMHFLEIEQETLEGTLPSESSSEADDGS